MNLPKRDTRAASHLDAIRGVSALVVLGEHARNLTLVDWDEATRRSALARPFYFLTGLGHQAVTVFFVLSGFFISSSVFAALARGRWSAKGYAESRLTRLYVVLVPALLLGWAFDRAGLGLFPASPVYQLGYGHMMSLPRATLGLRDLLVNLGFLQTIVGPQFGSNTPLWSLANEFWYYVAFPLFLFAIRARRPGVRVALFAGGLGVLALIGPGKSIGFGVWLLGTAVALAPPTRVSRSRVFRVVAWAAFLGVVAASRALPGRTNYDVAIGLAFAPLVWSLTSEDAKASPIYRRAAERLSGFSYTLYLVHVPFLAFAAAAILGVGPRLQPTAQGIGVVLGLGALAVGYAALVWLFTERRTDEVRRWVMGRTAPKTGVELTPP